MANKLHINAKKSCYIEFGTKHNKLADITDHNLEINGVPLLRVNETKFLGVTIDANLNFNTQRTKLLKKLATNSGILCRIKDNVPEELHKDLYHTLFESHLTYGISVWGGVSNNKLSPIFKMQKRCIRILFGNKDAYLEKFKTCARARPFEDQILGQEFFKREHTKPLFKKHKLFTVHNLYFFHCCNEVLKIIKHRTPISMFPMFEISRRIGKETFLIHPEPSESFAYRASVIWNYARSKIQFNDLSSPPSSFKSAIKRLITNTQQLGQPEHWNESLNFLNYSGKAWNHDQQPYPFQQPSNIILHYN